MEDFFFYFFIYIFLGGGGGGEKMKTKSKRELLHFNIMRGFLHTPRQFYIHPDNLWLRDL